MTVGQGEAVPNAWRWYVVYTRARQEQYAERHLQLRGVEVFFPRLLLPESARRSRRVVPLFPSYIFVRIFLRGHYERVYWCPGVKRFVSSNGSPAPVDEEIVLFLMRQADTDGLITARHDLKPGQEIRIKGGPFNDIAGVIQQPPDARGRVKVLLTLLSRHVKVELPARFIEHDWAVYPTAARKADIGPNLYQTAV